MIGSLVNAGAIIVGAVAGTLIHSKLPQRYMNLVFQAVGLFTMTIGITMALKSENLSLIIISLAVGAIIGEALGISQWLERSAGGLREKASKRFKVSSDETANERFVEGFVASTMLFCVGSMAVLGAFEEGMGEAPNILFTKSVIDGIAAVALGTTFGISIAFSSLPVFLYQGSLTILTMFLMRFMSDQMIADLTGTGGILLIGLGFSILKIKDINVVNLLPSLVVILILSYFW